MERRFDAEGRLIIDWERVKQGARRGGRATPDDVTVMSDGRRIDSADKLSALIVEFEHLQTGQPQRRTANVES